MNGRDRKVLQKMLTHAEHIQDYTGEMKSLDSFAADDKTVEACVFNMMQIGELAHAELSDECKSELTVIPWNQIYGMRNRIVHGYGEVSMDIVWETIETDIPVLMKELREALQADSEFTNA